MNVTLFGQYTRISIYVGIEKHPTPPTALAVQALLNVLAPSSQIGGTPSLTSPSNQALWSACCLSGWLLDRRTGWRSVWMV